MISLTLMGLLHTQPNSDKNTNGIIIDIIHAGGQSQMRGFLLGGLMTGVVSVFVLMGGDEKLVRAWENYRVAEIVAKGERLANEREKAFSDNYWPNPDCITPSGELKRLECRNRIEMARASYYARWNRENADRFPK